MATAELVPTGDVRDMVESALHPQALVKQVRLVQEVMAAVMRDGEHYGQLPGCQKPSLYKAGAEKLCFVFRLEPEPEIVRAVEEKDFIAFTVRCSLLHIPSGARVGSGMGSCSSRERKYAWRSAAHKCPHCARESIIKGREEYGGGWLCFKKKGGCGAKFPDGALEIESQTVGEIANPDIWDLHNTILKMAQKRALVAATLAATAASDIFTQDVEDLPEFAANGSAAAPPSASAPASQAPKAPARPPVDRSRMLPVIRTFLAYYEYICEHWPEMGAADRLLRQYLTLKKGGFPSLATILEFEKPKQLGWIATVNRQLERDFNLAEANITGRAVAPPSGDAEDIAEDEIPEAS